MAAAEPIFICDSHDEALWHEERRKGIGGSDAPCVLGLEKAWGSPFSISCLKRGITPPEGDGDSELLRWGHYVEAPMIQAFSDETGFKGQISGGLYRRTDELGFVQTTADGIVDESGKVGGIECKLSIFTSEEWERYGVPEHVVCQSQHAMLTMNWDFLYVLALLDGYRLRYKRLERNDEILRDVIIPAEADFWQRLQDGEQFDAGVGRPDQSLFFLKHLHPDDDGTTIQLAGDEWIQTLDRWVIAKREAKEAQTRADQEKARLIQAIGGHTFGKLDDGRRISLKTTERSAFETKASKFRTLREAK